MELLWTDHKVQSMCSKYKEGSWQEALTEKMNAIWCIVLKNPCIDKYDLIVIGCILKTTVTFSALNIININMKCNAIKYSHSFFVDAFLSIIAILISNTFNSEQ